MKQYNAIRSKHPNTILLFRVGDFYETFGEDAVKASRILGIVLTSRNNGDSNIELAGFPHHSLDSYLPKLVKAGERVAICDQLEDPKTAKGIVKRGVTELVTPGVSYNDLTYDSNKNNFLASVFVVKDTVGVSFLDISTGEFLISEGTIDYIGKLLHSFEPKEVIYPRQIKKIINSLTNKYCTFELADWIYEFDYANENLINQFGTKSLKGFGIHNLEKGIIAAGAILHYLKETEHNQTKHIQKLTRIEKSEYVWMDSFTIKNLELFTSPNQGAITLIDIVDKTKSPMGSRMIRRWLALPLKDSKEISDRHKIVKELVGSNFSSEKLGEYISVVGDLERLISKVATNRINPRQCVQLKKSLLALRPIKNICEDSNEKLLNEIGAKINLCTTVCDKIEKELEDDAPVLLSKGNVIKREVSSELDELRDIQDQGQEFLSDMLKREISSTGINSLKISFNNVFGYYLEVRNKYKDHVPENWIRKQTLVSSERYITEELKNYEHKILNARDKISVIESELYSNLVHSITDFLQQIQFNANLVSKLDCLLSFSIVASKNNYVNPLINNNSDLVIEEGRHPVIEKQLPNGEPYISNNVCLDRNRQQIMMITGPNMSGKSALLRQTAIIVLMAQIGSFVPAKKATIGIVDKIFTRVGASDNISLGESTFMVEMLETANILNNLSKNSLILLDEIGRGTSTYDGVSIAWAIAEYLHRSIEKPKTLFATHYHELNEMAQKFPRIKNFNVSVKQNKKKIIFLRKLKEGGCEHSFGINVASLAGIPNEVVIKANEVLSSLESSRSQTKKIDKNKMQLSVFEIDDPIANEIKSEISKINLNEITPLEALVKLSELKKMIGK